MHGRDGLTSLLCSRLPCLAAAATSPACSNASSPSPRRQWGRSNSIVHRLQRAPVTGSLRPTMPSLTEALERVGFLEPQEAQGLGGRGPPLGWRSPQAREAFAHADPERQIEIAARFSTFGTARSRSSSDQSRGRAPRRAASRCHTSGAATSRLTKRRTRRTTSSRWLGAGFLLRLEDLTARNGSERHPGRTSAPPHSMVVRDLRQPRVCSAECPSHTCASW